MDIASRPVVSVAALVVTIITLRKASVIQRELYTRQRLPIPLESLRVKNSAFNNLLNEPNFPVRDLRAHVFAIHALLASIKGRWQSVDLDAALQQATLIKSETAVEASTFGELYVMVGGVVGSLENHLADNELRIA